MNEQRKNEERCDNSCSVITIIKDRDEIFSVEWDDLKEKFKTLDDEEFGNFIKFMSDQEWLLTLDHPKIEKIIEILLCNITVRQCSGLLDSFMSLLEKRSNQITDNIDNSPGEKVIWNIYNRNYEVFEFIALQRWKYLSTGNHTIPTLLEEKNLCFLEVVLQANFCCKPLIELLLTDISLDHKAEDNDILDIILDSGHVEYLDKIFILLKQRKDAKENKKQETLREYLKKNNRRWIYRKAKDPLAYLTSILEVLTTYEVNISDMIFDPDLHCDILSECTSLEMVQLCIGLLPVERVKEALQKRGHRVISNLIERDDTDEYSKELAFMINLFEKEGVNMTPIFMARDHHDRLTLLDYICLHRELSYLKVILTRMDDTIKKILLSTRNYGDRDPLAHAKYYNFGTNTDKEDCIKAEINRLSNI
jgi:hypothetical protein